MSAGDHYHWVGTGPIDFTFWPPDEPQLATEAEHGPPPFQLGATHAVSICIGPETIERLTRGEAVEINGVTLYAADGLLAAPPDPPDAVWQMPPRAANPPSWDDVLAAMTATGDLPAPNRTAQIDAAYALLHANRHHAPTQEFAAEVVEAVLRAGEG